VLNAFEIDFEIPLASLSETQVFNQPSLASMIGSLRQAIGNHLVGREVLKADLSIACLVPNSMIPYSYMLCLWVVNRVVM